MVMVMESFRNKKNLEHKLSFRGRLKYLKWKLGFNLENLGWGLRFRLKYLSKVMPSYLLYYIKLIQFKLICFLIWPEIQYQKLFWKWSQIKYYCLQLKYKILIKMEEKNDKKNK